MSVESIFICPGQCPSSLIARVVSETRGPGHNQNRLSANFLHPAFCACIYFVTTRTLRFKRKKRVLARRISPKHFHNCFQKSGMVVCIRQFSPQTEVFGLQIPYPYSLTLYSKVVTLIRVRWYLNFERLFGNTKYITVVSIFWSSWTKSKHRIL